MCAKTKNKRLTVTKENDQGEILTLGSKFTGEKCRALKYPLKILMAELALLDTLQFTTVIRKRNDVNR